MSDNLGGWRLRLIAAADPYTLLAPGYERRSHVC